MLSSILGGVWGFACALGEGLFGDLTTCPAHSGGRLCLICTPGPLLASSGAQQGGDWGGTRRGEAADVGLRCCLCRFTSPTTPQSASPKAFSGRASAPTGLGSPVAQQGRVHTDLRDL